MADPWTQTLRARWRPSLRFYEKRIAILREFDERGVLVAFGVEQNRIGARFGGSNQLSVHQDGLTLALWGPDADIDHAWELVRVALDSLELTQITSMDLRLQHIVPLALPFEAAATAGLREIVQVPESGEMTYDDWALALDFHGPGDLAGNGEFGIIRAQEAAARITGAVGREGRSEWSSIAPEALQTEFPDVALFVDSRWRQRPVPDSQETQVIPAFWTDVRDRAGGLVDAIYARISNEGQGAGYQRRESG